MKHLNLKTLTTGLAALLLMFGILSNAALAAAPAAPKAKVIVAKSGGNYTTITAALNAITPTATTPYVIEVWPGVYTENVVLKSNVHLMGSGRDVTTIKNPTSGGNVISATNLTNVAVSGFTITGVGASSGGYGVSLTNTPATISNNTISYNGEGILIQNGSAALVTGNNIIANRWDGVDINNSSPAVTNNFISGNGSGTYNGDAGVYCDNPLGAPIIRDNVITGNNGSGIDLWDGCSPTISGNVVTDNTLVGVKDNGGTTGAITHNKVTNNGGATYTDIVMNGAPTVAPNISFNVFDDITGTTGVGSYNVNSNGDPILVP